MKTLHDIWDTNYLSFFCIFLRYANKEARCLNGRSDCFICEASSCIGAWQNRFLWEQKENLCKRWSNKGERYFHTLSSRSQVEWICRISNVKKNWNVFFFYLWFFWVEYFNCNLYNAVIFAIIKLWIIFLTY